MRAGRLVMILLILQQRGRVTGAELAAELEVSERTILRDIDELSGAGIPVYATRGPGGGFQLLEGYRVDLTPPVASSPTGRRSGVRRARVLITPEGRRLAAVLGILQPLRIRPDTSNATDPAARLAASFRMRGLDSTLVEILSLGPAVEVLEPDELRAAVADSARRTAELYERTRDRD